MTDYPTLGLNDGRRIPQLGFGTFKLSGEQLIYCYTLECNYNVGRRVNRLMHPHAPEGLDQNPAYYELLQEAAFKDAWGNNAAMASSGSFAPAQLGQSDSVSTPAARPPSGAPPGTLARFGDPLGPSY